MNKELEKLAQEFLRGQLPQDKFLLAIGVVLNAKFGKLTVMRDREVTDFAKKLAHFA